MTDKAREEFEAWWLSQEVCAKRWIVRSGDGYIANHEECTINEQWDAWQASRAALVITLPDQFDVGVASPCMALQADEVIAVIEAAGLKVKP